MKTSSHLVAKLHFCGPIFCVENGAAFRIQTVPKSGSVGGPVLGTTPNCTGGDNHGMAKKSVKSEPVFGASSSAKNLHRSTKGVYDL